MKKILCVKLLILFLLVPVSNIKAENNYKYEWTYTGANLEKNSDGKYELGTPLAEFLVDEEVNILTKIANIKNINKLKVLHELWVGDNMEKSDENEFEIGNKPVELIYAASNFGKPIPGEYELRVYLSTDDENYLEVDKKHIKILNLTQAELEKYEKYSEENSSDNKYANDPEIENRYLDDSDQGLYKIDNSIYHDPDIIIYPDRNRYWLYPAFYPNRYRGWYSRDYYNRRRNRQRPVQLPVEGRPIRDRDRPSQLPENRLNERFEDRGNFRDGINEDRLREIRGNRDNRTPRERIQNGNIDRNKNINRSRERVQPRERNRSNIERRAPRRSGGQRGGTRRGGGRR